MPRHLPDFSGVQPPPPLAEEELLSLSEAEALQQARSLPLGTRFALRAAITPIQHAFLAVHGFLVFDRVASPQELCTALC